MLLIALYIATVWVILILTRKIFTAAKAMRIPPALVSIVTVVGLVYVSCLIPGMFGMLYTRTAWCLFILLAVAGSLLVPRLSTQNLMAPATLDGGQGARSIDFTLIFFGLLGAIPVLDYLRWTLPSSLLNPDSALQWDTVSYHLPGFIEFSQHHTLWSLDGPYQSYSFGFELIGNFLSQPFHAHWGLIIANLLAIILLVIAIAAAARILVPSLPTTRVANWLPGAVLAIGIWCAFDPDSIGSVGKNDVFMAACLIAALTFLLEIAVSPRNDAYPARVWSLTVLVSISVGLALAAKPSALAFAPFFAIAIWVAVRSLGDGRSTVQRATMAAVLVLTVSALLGGFWLVRNLLVYGHLSPILADAEKLSLIANLTNPALYEIKRGSILFSLGVSAIVPGLFLVRRCRSKHQHSLPLGFLVVFHIVACGAFAMTPHAIFHDDTSVSVWKLRLGMPLFVSAALIYSLTAVYFGAIISEWSRRKQAAVASALILFCMLALPWHWYSAGLAGLPGYERVKNLPRTGAYDWVQNLGVPQRIYSAGLRPYGLYGKKWANTLFYDLHSTVLSPLSSGKERIAAIVVNFQPDLILISVDPHGYTTAAIKPDIVSWMKQQPDSFEEVYSDETVTGFRVRSNASEHLRAVIPAGYELKMGG